MRIGTNAVLTSRKTLWMTSFSRIFVEFVMPEKSALALKGVLAPDRKVKVSGNMYAQ